MPQKYLEVSRIVEILSKRSHNSLVYNIHTVDSRILANADGLKGFVMPFGLGPIGNFAFVDYDSLTGVVPFGNPIALGQRLFFKCWNSIV